MGVLLYLAGLIILISGLLSLAGITDFGLNYVSLLKIHLLPFLSSIPVAWVYIVLGLLIIIIANRIPR